jgi:prefoldin subunit 5
MSDIQSRALAAAISREREASRDWSKAAKEYRKRIAELEKYRDILESEVIQRTDRIAELEGALKECKAKAYSLRTVESIVDRALLGGGDG